MARPIHETPYNVRREHRVAKLMAETYGLEAWRFPKLSVVDWGIGRAQRFDALAECKSRWPNYSYGWMARNGGYMISKDKCDKALKMSAWQQVPFLLVIELTDGVFRALFDDGLPDQSLWRVKEGGRKDRREKRDIEPCYFFSMTLFERLADGPLFVAARKKTLQANDRSNVVRFVRKEAR